MRLVITSPLFPPGYMGGGPVRTIEAMLRGADSRHDLKVVADNRDYGQNELLVPPGNRWVEWNNARVMYVNRGVRSWARALRSMLALRPDAYYLNSMFHPRFSVSMELLTSMNRSTPVAIAPRGELNEGALAIKSEKKTLFLEAARASRLLTQVIWHASSELEAADVRREFGEDARIIIRENDTLLPSRAEPSPGDVHSTLQAVFMSRLSPKKGLDVALEALKEVRRPVEFDVIGPEEDRVYVERCKDLAEKLADNVTVRFLGAVPAESIRSALAAYDVMVFPTAGENFGHVIGEALSVSLPVMLTDTTPWSPTILRGGGVLINGQNARDWAKQIEAYAASGPKAWAARRRSAAESYNTWQSTSGQPHFFDLLEAVIS